MEEQSLIQMLYHYILRAGTATKWYLVLFIQPDGSYSIWAFTESPTRAEFAPNMMPVPVMTFIFIGFRRHPMYYARMSK